MSQDKMPAKKPESERPDIFLRGYISGKGCNVNEAAEIIGVSRQTISALINGKQIPTIADALQWGEQFGRHEERRRSRAA